MGISNILVYATNFKIEKGRWGYKWFGFCDGKRFTVIQDAKIQEVTFDELSGEYMIGNENHRKLLPMEIQKLTYENPLSNHYFECLKHKELSFEIVMQIIEKGYDVKNIKMEDYCKYCDKGEPFSFRYIDKETKKVIVTIFEDLSVVWEE